MTEAGKPSTDLRVSLIQGATHWHDAKANRVMYGDLVRPLAGQTDLVVLPETFTSGFTNDTLANAEGMDGVTVRWLGALASEVGAVVTGSVVIHDGDRYVNRLIWMRPDETCEIYDKRHLFRMANEHERYAGGGERLIVELNGWRHGATDSQGRRRRRRRHLGPRRHRAVHRGRHQDRRPHPDSEAGGLPRETRQRGDYRDLVTFRLMNEAGGSEYVNHVEKEAARTLAGTRAAADDSPEGSRRFQCRQ